MVKVVLEGVSGIGSEARYIGTMDIDEGSGDGWAEWGVKVSDNAGNVSNRVRWIMYGGVEVMGNGFVISTGVKENGRANHGRMSGYLWACRRARC